MPLRTWTFVALVLMVLGSFLLPRLLAGPGPPVEREWAARPATATSEPTTTPVPEREASDARPPGHLKIPAIGVDAAIVPVGVTPDGFMDAPDGPDDTGWYKHGPRPGEVGSAVIALPLLLALRRVKLLG